MKKQKTLRTLLATLLLIVIVAMSIPSFAATPTGSITLNKTENGAKITLYQLATFSYNETTSQPIYPTYKWNTAVNNWLADEAHGYTAYAGDAGAEAFGKLEDDSTTVKEVYGAITAAIRTEGQLAVSAFKEVTATGETTTIEDLPIGTYAIVVESATRIYQTVVRNVGMKWDDTTSAWVVDNGTVDVELKSDNITIEKKADVTNQKTTEDITYTIKSDVPSYPASAISTVYKIADKLPSAITADIASIDVKGLAANGDETPLTLGTEYTVDSTATDDYTFIIDFADYTLIKGFEKIQVTYTAKIKADAGTELNTELKNGAYLVYSNDPYTKDNYTEGKDDPDGPKTEEKVKTYGFVVNKVDGTNENAPLAGATFKVYADEAKATTLTFTETATGSGIYYYDKESTVTELNVNTAGHLEVRGLNAGTYYLEETKAPNGFNKLSKVEKIVVAENEDAQSHEIVNNKGFKLPLTGGMGTVIFTITGVAFIVLGAVLLITINKKKNAKN